MRKKDESAIRSEVVGRVFDRCVAAASQGGQPLDEVVNETLYHEFERLRTDRSSRSSSGDKDFYYEIRRALPQANLPMLKEMLGAILERYAVEIAGHFSPAVYGVATRVIPVALGGLLNGLSPIKVISRMSSLAPLENQVVVQGATEHIKRLNDLGTLVFAPTHSSNLDSVLMGYIIYSLGLPPVTYGAGLNLFTNPMVGFFMRNLGAYTVDRRKTDPLYREALKEYATVTLEFGYSNLFFPGGTRARSNAVERGLKKGLLGTTVTAYLNNLNARKKTPSLFIVPCTISYPLVLEAATLIEDHLKAQGKARYIIEDDEFSQVQRWIDFARGLMTMEQKIYVTFGEPLDPFGNPVDEEGRSLDPCGRAIEASRYLSVRGRYVVDAARDREYTRDLADAVVGSYLRHNVIFPTNLLAWSFFTLLRRQAPEADLYRFLRSIGPETSVPLAEVEAEVEELLVRLRALASDGEIILSPALETGRTADIVRNALGLFGTYHTTPVVERRGIRLHVGDDNLLLYYRNRLEGYGLPGSGGGADRGRRA